MPDNNSQTLSKEERDAVKNRTRELKEQTTKAAAAKGVDDAIAALPAEDRALAERLHAMVRAAAPHLDPKTYYGMPAYANAEGKVVCFFQPASKFKVRYGTFGFETAAQLDDGDMWPTAFAVNKLSAADEAKLAELVKKAAR